MTTDFDRAQLVHASREWLINEWVRHRDLVRSLEAQLEHMEQERDQALYEVEKLVSL